MHVHSAFLVLKNNSGIAMMACERCGFEKENYDEIQDNSNSSSSIWDCYNSL